MDPTKRKRTRKKVAPPKERSSQLVQGSGVAMLVSRGMAQEVEMVNAKFTRLFGYTLKDMPDIAHWWPLAYPDRKYRQTVKAEWQKRIAKAIANHGEIEPMEAKVRCKDGSERYIEFHFSCVGDANLVSFIDMTERKRAEIALRESEERFRLVANEAPVLIWMSGPDKLCTYFNKPWLDFTGRSMEEELGNGWAEGVHPEDVQECLDTYAQSFDRRGKFKMEYRLRHREGEYRWILDIGVPRFNPDGSFAGYIGVAIDVTERKHAEKSLRESEEKFRRVFRDAGVGKVLVSPEGRFLAANEAFCACLGYTEKELMGRTVESITLKDDWPAFSQKLRDSLIAGHGFKWAEKRCLHKSGRIVYTESSTSLIKDRDGTPQYFVGEVLDVSQRKEAVEALSGMTRKLVEAQEQERTRIARELHDDVNQRLALLAVELEQLQDGPSRVQNRVRELQQRITEIANDIQAVAHDLHSSNLEYLGVASAMKSWCKEFGKRQKLEINCRHDVRSDLPNEIGICLFRVLQEALHNAVKHSGVKRIEVNLREEPGEIHLTVIDSGRGFDVEAVKQGKGLGLTSMQERVRLVNGTIGIESRPMGGTTIHVRVPIVSEYGARRVAV